LEKRIAGPASTRDARLATAVVAFLTLLSLGLRSSGAQTFTPQNEDWKGNTLDPAKWHATIFGDAQTETNGIEVNNGSIKITAGGSDIWNDNDNGFFLWQPVNGDFQATIEVRSLKMVSGTTAVGLMVRPSLDLHAPEVFLKTMPVGTHIQTRQEVGADTGPASGDAGRLAWGDGSGNGPTILLRLTRTGNSFKSERSDDGGKTWGRTHDADHPDTDTVQLTLPDDVLLGIALGAVNADAGNEEVTEAVLGPFTITSTATRPTRNGLVALTAVDANNKPAAGSFLIVKNANGDTVGSTKNDITSPGTSNTGSFFLPPGTYTVEAGESDTFAAGQPVPFEIKTAQTVVLPVAVGKAK
jgi:hypothetical protein